MDSSKSPVPNLPFAGSAGDFGDVAMLKALCENVADYLCVLDSERRVCWTNRVHPKASVEAVIGATVDSFLNPEAANTFREQFARVQANGEPVTYTTFNGFLDEAAWVEQRLLAVKDHGDRFLLISRNITSMHKAQLASEASDLLVRNLIENFPDIIFVMEPSGVVIASNEITARSLGTTREQLIGSVAWDHMPPPASQRRQQYAEEVCRSKLPLRRTDENAGLIFDSVGYPLLRENGQVKAIAVISRDVTQQRKAEEMLRQKHARRSYSEKMEGLGALAAGISHDFNNLLTPILVNSARAARPDCSPERRTSLLASVVEAAERATKLIRQIVVFGDGGDRNIGPCNLRDALSETIGFVRSTLASNVTINASLPEQPLWAPVDMVQVNQAIINLCINADQAMAPTGGTLRIDLRLHEDLASLPNGLTQVPHICIEVSDSGPGMDEAILPQIFAPFYSTKSPDQGSGLGLFVVHSVASNHEGAVTVHSKPGEGCSFFLWLPCGTALDAPGPSQPEDRGGPEATGLRVLLLEDDDLVSEAVGSVLSDNQFTVTRFSTCADALHCLRSASKSFDIAILDRRLGDGSGLDVALHIREGRPDFPIVLSSGHLDAEVRRICQAHGLTILPKPYRPEQLLQAITMTRQRES